MCSELQRLPAASRFEFTGCLPRLPESSQATDSEHSRMNAVEDFFKTLARRRLRRDSAGSGRSSGRRAGDYATGLTETAPSATGSRAGQNGSRPQTQSRRKGAMEWTPFNPGTVGERVRCARGKKSFTPRMPPRGQERQLIDSFGVLPSLASGKPGTDQRSAAVRASSRTSAENSSAMPVLQWRLQRRPARWW